MARTNEDLFKREKAAGMEADGGVRVEDVQRVRRWADLNLLRALLPAVGAVVGCFAI